MKPGQDCAPSSPIVLVIDDCHVLDEPSTYDGLDFLLKHLPRQLRLVIASRRQPPLDLAFLHTKGWVTELGADALRFTGEEVSRFFEQKTGLHLPPETVQALEARTEGWVTALQLAAISVRSQADLLALLGDVHGDAGYLVGFLCEEVLSRQPEVVRSFLPGARGHREISFGRRRRCLSTR
jgi:LuxR family maltose regulon positive regulatory protein